MMTKLFLTIKQDDSSLIVQQSTYSFEEIIFILINFQDTKVVKDWHLF